MSPRLLPAALVLPACVLPVPASGQTAALPEARPSLAEERAARHFDAIKADPVALRAFLREMPKGGDLHTHLSGAVYAESFIRWAAEDSLCVDTKAVAILRDREPCDARKGQRPAKEAHADPAFHALLVDTLSTRHYHPARKAGHYQFFDAWDHMGPVPSRRGGDMLAEVARRAAAQNVLHLETMGTWDLKVAMAAAAKVEWTDDLGALHRRLLEAGLREAPKTAELDADEARMRELLRCGTREAEPGCGVSIRYIAQTFRAFAPLEVFAMLVWSFEQSAADARFAGINMVQPEDWHVPVRDYDLHMAMIEHLHGRYPRVNIALHAGELALGQVPPEVLGTHVAKAVARGQARRIGHGTDIAYHPRPYELMAEMKRKDVALEVSLSSSDIILGVRGERHPLRAYLTAGVPVVLATDDEGVARSDLTNEYLRAAVEQGLGYREIKKISRDSLRYSFLEAGPKQALVARLERAFAEFEANAAR